MLSSIEVRHISERVEYCINSTHLPHFSVAADVVPVSVELSNEDFMFEFSVDSWEPYVEQVLVSADACVGKRGVATCY